MPPPTVTNYVPALRFNWLTPYYDAIVRATTREQLFKRALIRQATIQPGHHVLDLATGTGTLAIWVKQSEPLCVVAGVDGDPNILEIASHKAHAAKVEIQFSCGLSYDMPYATEQFDRVLSSLFFHHLTWEQKQKTAEELFRVIRPGGELHIADWGYPTSALMRGLFLSIQMLDGFKNTQDNVSGKLIGLFQAAGFAEVSQQNTFNTIFGTMALYRAVKY